MNFANLLGAATKVPIFIPEYNDQWADHMEQYLNEIDEYLWRSIETGPYRVDLVQAVGKARAAEEGEPRQALPHVVYKYVRVCKISKEIQGTLKEKYQGNERTKE